MRGDPTHYPAYDQKVTDDGEDEYGDWIANDRYEAIEHRLACSCGCKATKPDDGSCECGRPLGHK